MDLEFRNKIKSKAQIIDHLERDGDLRIQADFEYFDFEYEKNDDLGFYQQACEFLLKVNGEK